MKRFKASAAPITEESFNLSREDIMAHEGIYVCQAFSDDRFITLSNGVQKCTLFISGEDIEPLDAHHSWEHAKFKRLDEELWIETRPNG